MRSALFLVLAIVVPLSTLVATDSRGGGLKRPLDLPAGTSGRDSEDEDSPETIIFYGSEYEADAFFFCFPAFDF